jgi:hypothetical protein
MSSTDAGARTTDSPATSGAGAASTTGWSAPYGSRAAGGRRDLAEWGWGSNRVFIASPALDDDATELAALADAIKASTGGRKASLEADTLLVPGCAAGALTASWRGRSVDPPPSRRGARVPPTDTRRPSMEIVVEVVGSPVSESVPPPGANRHGPGHRTVFSDNLVLQSVDPQVPGKPKLEPGNGLPLLPDDRRAGTQSGFVTTLRFSEANDEFLPGGSGLFQYRLNTLTHAGQTVLQAGQITARGVKLSPIPPGEVVTFAITGGTGPYANARGQITEDGALRELHIV